MNFLRDLGVFLRAVINNWAGYTTGGVIVAFVTLYVMLRETAVPKRWAIALALFFLLLAFFNAWRNEYLKTHPGLALKVFEVWKMKPKDNQDPNTTRLVIIASISNLGNPTIAENWKIRIKDSGSEKWSDFVSYSLVDPGNVILIEIEEVPFPVFYNPMDALYFKTSSPVPTGMKFNGLVAVHMEQLDFSKLRQNGAQIEVQCQDIAGNKISGVLTVDDKTPKVPDYYSGMTPVGRMTKH